jgi:hypothetical protein
VHDPLSRAALARVRWHLRLIGQYDADLEDVDRVTVAGGVVAIRALGRTLVTHDVPCANRGGIAAWPLSYLDGLVLLDFLLPPMPVARSDDSVRAVSIVVVDGENFEETFLAFEDVEVRT